jgi:hypothetical protein
MSFCPNVNSKEFKELENVVGTANAYFIWDANKGNPIDLTSEGETSSLFNGLVQATGSREDAILAKSFIYTNEFKEWWNSDSEPKLNIKDVDGDPIYYYTRVEGSEDVKDIANALTVHPFNAEVLYQSKGRLAALDDYYLSKRRERNNKKSKRTVSKVSKINTQSPVMRDKSLDQGFYMGDEALKFQEERDLNNYEQRLSTAKTEKMPHAQRKIEYMAKRIGAKVVLDNTIPVSGQVLPKNHPLTRQYEQPVIVINPDRLFEDTVLHEFGHIFIDVLGGLSNKRIASAVDALKGSSLWNVIAANYPELNNNNLSKEVLATALGLEASDLFELNADRNWWQRFKDWFVNNINKLFNFPLDDTSSVTSLAKEMLFANISKKEAYQALPEFLTNNRKDVDVTSQQAIVDHIKQVSDSIRLDEDTHVYYVTVEDKEIPITESVTQFINQDTTFLPHVDIQIERFKNLKASREFAPSFLVAFNELHGYEQLNNSDFLEAFTKEEMDELNKLSSDIYQGWIKQSEIGTQAHAILESYINGEITELPDGFKSLIPITKMIDSRKKKGSVFIPEAKLLIGELNSDVNKMAGSADIIEITPNNRIIIHDFKTSTNSSFSDKYFEHKYSKHRAQLMAYKAMIELTSNIQVQGLTIHNIRIDDFNRDTGEFADILLEDSKDMTARPEFEAEYQRMKKRVKDNFMPSIDNIDKTSLTNKLNELMERVIDDIDIMTKNLKFKKGSLKSLDPIQLESLKKELFEAAELNQLQKINMYFDNFVTNVVEEMNTKFKELGKTGRLDTEFLKEMGVYVNAFDQTISEAVDILNENYTEEENSEIREAYEKLNNELNGIKAMLKEQTIRKAASLFADSSNIQRVKFTERFRAEAEEKFTTDSEKSKYVHEQLQKHATEMYNEEFNYWKEQFRSPKADIGSFEAQVFDPSIINSQFVQVVNQVLEYQDSLVRKKTIDFRNELVERMQDFDFVKEGGNMEEKFGKFFAKDSDGNLTNYFIGRYKAEFHETYSQLMSEVTKTEFNKYDKDGKKAHAEAKAALRKFVTENISSDKKPINKWLDPEYNKLSEEEIDFLNQIKSYISRGDAMLSKGKLTRRLPGLKRDIVFHRVPSMHKNNMERIIENGVKALYENIADNFKVRATDEDRGTLVNADTKEALEDAQSKVKGNIDNTLRREIPMFMRGEVKPSDQSRDILSLVMLNYEASLTHNVRSQTEADIHTMASAVENTRFADHVGLSRKLLGNALSSSKFRVIRDKTASDSSNTFKALRSMIENRLYSIQTINSGTVGKWDLNKTFRNINAFNSKMVLAINPASAGATLLQTEAVKLMEGLAGEYFSSSDIAYGHSQVIGDVGGWMADLVHNVPTSKTNLLMELFDLSGDFKALIHKFSNNSAWKKLAASSPLHAMTSASEFYAGASLMYTMLKATKVTNIDGQFIDSEGKVVNDKKDAMSLAEAYSVEDGKLKLNKHAYATERNTFLPLDQDAGHVQISSWMKEIYADLNGQYSKEMKSLFQRTIIGEIVTTLRKWLVRGVNKRYRGITTAGKAKEDLTEEDRFFSQAKMQYQEGMYVTAIRFLNTIRKDMNNFSVDMLSANWNKLNQHEKANIKRTATEVALIGLSIGLAVLAIAGAEDDEDYVAAYYAQRLYSELSFYLNPIEAFKIMKSPAASLSLVFSTYKLMSRVVTPWNWDETYEKGPRKGDYKFTKDIERVAPIIDKYHLIFDDKSTFKNKLEFLTNTNML